MKAKYFLLSLVTVFMLAVLPVFGQKAVQVRVAPEHADWTYNKGEKLKFDVTVTRDNVVIKDAEVEYEIGYDMMPPFKTGTGKLRNGQLTIDVGTINKEGFVRCKVITRQDGYRYEGMATAGFDPYSIRPVTTDPADFDKFWSAAKAELAKVEMNPILTLMPEKCTSKTDVYHISIQNTGGSRVYGILCVPKNPGKYPAILNVPGAGIRPYHGDIATADQGYITLQIGIHGVPVNLPDQVYVDLATGPLDHYMTIRLDDKDNYYYRRVYLGCVRAIDYLVSMEQYDGENLFVRGGSQGGALSIVSAGLDSRVKAIAAYYPALCDMAGYRFGRAGGWPHLFSNETDIATKERVNTTYYYDVVNFARRVKAAGFYSMGYNDVVCPPTSMFAAYNVITAPKEIFVVPETGHYTYHEQTDKAWRWLGAQVK